MATLTNSSQMQTQVTGLDTKNSIRVTLEKSNALSHLHPIPVNLTGDMSTNKSDIVTGVGYITTQFFCKLQWHARTNTQHLYEIASA